MVKQVAKHAIIESLQLYANFQELQNLRIHQSVLGQSDTTMPCMPLSPQFVCSPAEMNTHRKNQFRS